VQLYYDSDSFRLNNRQKYLLDSVVENFSNRRLIINGHADYQGSEDHNKMIADQRAKAALRYLVDRGFPETQIMEAIGFGQTAMSHSVNAVHKNDDSARRVDIFITKGLLVKSKLKTLVLPDTHTVQKAPPPKNVTDIDYKKVKVGDIIALKNINFIPGSDTILPESYDELNNLFLTLKANPTLKIKLEGHVCCSIYPDGYIENTPNWQLSVARALMVEHLLIELGIAPERLSYQGFGRTRPLYAQDATPEQSHANRRVEIRIIAK